MNVNLIYLITGANFLILLGISALFLQHLASLDGDDGTMQAVKSVIKQDSPIMVSLEGSPSQ